MSYPDELEEVAKSPIAVSVWDDHLDEEIHSYYVSPRWYVTDEGWDFLAEYNWSKKDGNYWKQNARYAEAVEYFESMCNFYASGGNKGGA